MDNISLASKYTSMNPLFGRVASPAATTAPAPLVTSSYKSEMKVRRKGVEVAEK